MASSSSSCHGSLLISNPSDGCSVANQLNVDERSALLVWGLRCIIHNLTGPPRREPAPRHSGRVPMEGSQENFTTGMCSATNPEKPSDSLCLCLSLSRWFPEHRCSCVPLLFQTSKHGRFINLNGLPTHFTHMLYVIKVKLSYAQRVKH